MRELIYNMPLVSGVMDMSVSCVHSRRKVVMFWVNRSRLVVVKVTSTLSISYKVAQKQKSVSVEEPLNFSHAGQIQ